MQPYRLTERDGAGLACDEQGLALGGVELVNARQDENGVIRCDVRSPGEFASISPNPTPRAQWLPVHSGSHPSYNDQIAQLIATEEAKFGSPPTPLEARAIMDEVARVNRTRLLSGGYGPVVRFQS